MPKIKLLTTARIDGALRSPAEFADGEVTVSEAEARRLVDDEKKARRVTASTPKKKVPAKPAPPPPPPPASGAADSPGSADS